MDLQRLYNRNSRVMTRKGHYAWMVLLSFPGYMDNAEREKRRRLFCDRLRKEHVWYVWVKEQHTKRLAGLYHYHFVVHRLQKWNYGSRVQGWSKRYGGSPNALQIKPVRRTFMYLIRYMGKREQKLEKGHGRTWGRGSPPRMSSLKDFRLMDRERWLVEMLWHFDHRPILGGRYIWRVGEADGLRSELLALRERAKTKLGTVLAMLLRQKRK